jgi:UDP-hydrolysing UDP-N-acetyl-D-glucosamine 2-epimerase
VRTIAVVTGSRADYGIYGPLLRTILSDQDLTLHLIVSGMHLAPEFGLTVRFIEQDGVPVHDRIEMLLASDSPEGIAKSVGLGIIGYAQSFSRNRPDMLMVLGDRFEMYAAAVAALPFRIPVAHIHGGELTAGAIDDALRHSMTKLSHLHFVATDAYAQRVIQLGEEPWRVTVSGAPGLDNLRTVNLLTREELETGYNLSLAKPPLLVTFHPVTLECNRTDWQVSELLHALHDADTPIVFTMPNADTSGRTVLRMIEEFVREHASARLVDNLGTQAYFSMMALASAMVGNSSSGIVEAASFKLPVVNIGSRQEGRVRAENVIDVGYQSADIARGLRLAGDPGFRATLAHVVNPYGDGTASPKIVSRIKEVSLDASLLVKHFFDMDASRMARAQT